MLISTIKKINNSFRNNLGTNSLLYMFSRQNNKKHFFNIKDEPPERSKKAIIPKQYPTNLVDGSPMIERGRPVRFLTPRDEVG